MRILSVGSVRARDDSCNNATGHVEVLANRVRELCAAFDELDADGLGDDAQEALWRAYDLMENACLALDEAGRDGEDGQ